MSACTDFSLNLRPIKRFTSKTVFSGLMVAWFFAASPIRLSPASSHATYEGVMRLPWSFAMISTRPFWKTPTPQYVVPKSIPMTVPRSSWATAAVASAAAASAVRSILLF